MLDFYRILDYLSTKNKTDMVGLQEASPGRKNSDSVTMRTNTTPGARSASYVPSPDDKNEDVHKGEKKRHSVFGGLFKKDKKKEKEEKKKEKH